MFLSVLCFCTIAEQGEVRFKSAGCYPPVECCLIHCATGFARVCAVRIATIGTDTKYLAEIVPNLLFLHIYRPKSLYPWCINDPRTILVSIVLCPLSIVHCPLSLNLYISEKVVVCVPLLCAFEIAPVRANSSPKIALSSVDLPTPELPLISVIFP